MNSHLFIYSLYFSIIFDVLKGREKKNVSHIVLQKTLLFFTVQLEATFIATLSRDM